MRSMGRDNLGLGFDSCLRQILFVVNVSVSAMKLT